MTSLLNQLATDQVLTQAFQWPCQTRAHYHHNDDVWHVRYWWARHKPWLQAQLCAEHVSRLYEQGADVSRIGTYMQRWGQWERAGLGEMRRDWVVKSPTKLCDGKTIP